MTRLPLSRLKCAKFWLTQMAAVSVTLTLSACSSGGESDSGANTGITSPFPSAVFDTGPDSVIVTGADETNADAVAEWLAIINMFRLNSRLAETGDGSVRLLRFDTPFPESELVDFYETDLETCEINDPNAPATGGGGNDDSLPLLSGGATITINTPEGPWVTFDRSIEVGESIYEIENDLPGELLPTGATVSIPGDVFPSVTAHPLFEGVPPERLLPDADFGLTADSAYSWIPGSNKTLIEIDFLAFDPIDGSFIDFAGGCDVIDDGSFTMPAEVIEFISTTPLRIEARYERVYSRVDFVDGIAIRQRNVLRE